MRSASTFGELLRDARRAAGLTQGALAEHAGVSVRTIMDLERGVNRAPRRDTLARLAQALNLPLAERAHWERLRQRAAIRATPARSANVGRRASMNLPVVFDELIGRDREIADVTALLMTSRLVTLTGAGGIGKTRLAIAAGHEAAEAFPDGVCFVDLAPVRDPGLVVAAIAQALGVTEAGGRSLVEGVTTYLQQRRLLLVIDNVEHVITAAPLLLELLAHAPHVKILATSRTRLGLRAEREYPVSALGLPESQGFVPADTLLQYAAPALFVRRARQFRPDFEVTSSAAETIVEICRRLGGLPLAIELAAARISVLSLPEMLERLGRPLSVLTGGARDLPERQQTLRNTIQWSYDLLGPAEQVAFRRLAVFVGGWTLDAAEAILNASSDSTVASEWAPLDLLTKLVDWNLVIVRDPSDGERRFSILETIREFGLERLAESGDEAPARERHACYMLQLVEDQERLYEGSRQDTALQRLGREQANIRAALDWFIARHDTESGLQLAGSMWMFWQLCGHLSEGRRYYEALLASSDDGIPPKLRAKALTGAGTLAAWQQEAEVAIAQHEEALAIWLDLPPEEQTDAWRSMAILGDLALNHGNLAEAEARYEGLLAHSRSVGATRGIFAGLYHLSRVADTRGNVDEALGLLLECEGLVREAGDIFGRSLVTSHLGYIALGRGEFERAEELLRESFELDLRLGVRSDLSENFYDLGWVNLYQGRMAEAVSLFEEGMAIARDVGNNAGIIDGLHAAGEVALRTGDLGNAETQLREGLLLAQPINRQPMMTELIESLARVQLARGRADAAVTLVSTAARARHERGIPATDIAREQNERLIEGARRGISGESFERAWAHGQTMSLDEAVNNLHELVPPDARGPSPTPIAGLSQREVDVLRLLIDGRSNREIAYTLSISPHTAARHVANIMSKLGLESRTAAATWAVRHGIA